MVHTQRQPRYWAMKPPHIGPTESGQTESARIRLAQQTPHSLPTLSMGELYSPAGPNDWTKTIREFAKPRFSTG